MLRWRFGFPVLLLIPGLGCCDGRIAPAGAPLSGWEPGDARAAFARSEDSGEDVHLHVQISKAVAYDATLSATHKGNGTLAVANLLLRIRDEHDDGVTYEGGSLDVEFVDVDGDGENDLAVGGIIVLMADEKGGAARREPLSILYRHDSSAGGFVPSYRRTPVEIDLRTSGSGS